LLSGNFKDRNFNLKQKSTRDTTERHLLIQEPRKLERTLSGFAIDQREKLRRNNGER
jgi:hypothetical protein